MDLNDVVVVEIDGGEAVRLRVKGGEAVRLRRCDERENESRG